MIDNFGHVPSSPVAAPRRPRQQQEVEAEFAVEEGEKAAHSSCRESSASDLALLGLRRERVRNFRGGEELEKGSFFPFCKKFENGC